MLIQLSAKFMKSRNYSKVKLTGVGAFLEYLEVTYDVSCLTLNLGSLIISLDCKTLKGLDKLWNDYLSGHLNQVANWHLVTVEVMKNLNLKTINLKTTIDEKNYLNCRKMLMESSGEYKYFFRCVIILWCMCVGLILALGCQVSLLYQRSVILIIISNTGCAEECLK